MCKAIHVKQYNEVLLPVKLQKYQMYIKTNKCAYTMVLLANKVN